MELEHIDEEEKENRCKSLSDNNEELGGSDPANCEGTSAKESECITKPTSSLPQNKEELERTIKNIHGTITGDILPRLHKCLASTVILMFGAQQVCVVWGVRGALSDCFLAIIDFFFFSISTFYNSLPFSCHLEVHLLQLGNTFLNYDFHVVDICFSISEVDISKTGY